MFLARWGQQMSWGDWSCPSFEPNSLSFLHHPLSEGNPLLIIYYILNSVMNNVLTLKPSETKNTMWFYMVEWNWLFFHWLFLVWYTQNQDEWVRSCRVYTVFKYPNHRAPQMVKPVTPGHGLTQHVWLRWEETGLGSGWQQVRGPSFPELRVGEWSGGWEPGLASEIRSKLKELTSSHLKQGPEGRITSAVGQTWGQKARVSAEVSKIMTQLRGHLKFRVTRYCTAEVLGTYTSQWILTLKLGTGYHHHYL